MPVRIVSAPSRLPEERLVCRVVIVDIVDVDVPSAYTGRRGRLLVVYLKPVAERVATVAVEVEVVVRQPVGIATVPD